MWGCSLGFPLEQESSPRPQVCDQWAGDPWWEPVSTLRPLWRGGGAGLGNLGSRPRVGTPCAPALVLVAENWWTEHLTEIPSVCEAA